MESRSPGQVDTSSLSNIEEALKPLIGLDDLLYKLKKCAEQLRSNIETAKERVNPPFYKPWLPQVSEEEKKALVDLLSQLGSEEKLTEKLSLLINVAQSFHNIFKIRKESIERYFKSSEQVKLEMNRCYWEIRQEFNADCRDYKQADDVSEHFKQVVKSSESMLKEALLEVTARLNIAADLNKNSLSNINNLKTIPHQPVAEVATLVVIRKAKFDAMALAKIEEKTEKIIKEASGLIGGSVGNYSLGQLENDIEQQLESLQKLQSRYLQVVTDYQSLDIGSLQKEESEISKEVVALQKELAQNNNDDAISKLFISYLDSEEGSREDIAQAFEASLKGLISEKNEKANILSAEFSSLKSKAERFQAKVVATQERLRKLTSEFQQGNPSSLKEVSIGDFERIVGVHGSLITQQSSMLMDSESKLNKISNDIEAVRKRYTLYLDEICAAITNDKYRDKEECKNIFEDLEKELSERILILEPHISQANALHNDVEKFLKELEEAKSKYFHTEQYWQEIADSIGRLSSQEEIHRFKENITKIKKIKEKWEKSLGDLNGSKGLKSRLLMLPRRCSFEPSFIEEYLFNLNKSLSELPIHTINFPPSDDQNSSLCQEIIQCARSLAKVVGEIKKHFQDVLPVENINENLHKLFVAEPVTQQEAEKWINDFLEYYQYIGWGQLVSLPEKEVDLLAQTPENLNRDISCLREHFKNLWSEDNKQLGFKKRISSQQEVLNEYINDLQRYLGEMKNKQENIKFYLNVWKDYKDKNHYYNIKLEAISSWLQSLRDEMVFFDKLKSNNQFCLGTLLSLKKLKAEIEKARSDACNSMQHISIAHAPESLADAFRKMDKVGLKLERDAENLVERINKLKDKKDKRQQEIFLRLKRRFLFTGKSRQLIEKLKAHGELAMRQQRAKGEVIAKFIKSFFEAGSIENEEQMTVFLSKESNKELTHNTGCSNWLGVDSTSGSLLSELRNEWNTLTEREKIGEVGSISYAFQCEYDEMKSAYRAMIEKKDFGASLLEVNSEYGYARFASSICENLIGGDLPSHVERKIQHDIVEIQSWVNDNKAGLFMRHARLKCALEIRKAEDSSLQNEELFRRLSEVAEEYPFTFAYHSLKCHLGKYSTNRMGSSKKLWKMLDDIAFGEGEESDKYEKMKEGVLGFYRNLREKTNGSAGVFFGNGSRLGNGLEAFLKYPKKPTERYEFGLGYNADQVNHRKSDTQFEKTMLWVRDHVSCCGSRQ